MGRCKNLIIFLISIIVTFSLNINLDENLSFMQSFSGNSIVYVFIFILIYWLLKDVAEIKNKRLSICCLILSIILAIFETAGSCMWLNGELNALFSIKGIFNLIGYFIALYSIIFKLFSKLEKLEIKTIEKNFFTNNKKSFFIVWGIIFLAWMPYFLKHFPGICTPDSISQILQGLGINELTNHHPVVHTFLISIAIKIGSSIGNYAVGVAIYSIFQMIILSVIFSFTVYYMAKRKVDIRIRVIAFLFYALYPINAIYSVTMWKDILFAGSILIYSIMLSELVSDKNNFMNSKMKQIFLVLSMIAVILFKNNGIYIVVISLPFIFFLAKEYSKKLIVLFIIVLSVYIIWKGPIFSALNIKQGGIKEALSIPLQQFARISKEHGDELTDIEKSNIYKYLPVENLGDIYVPTLSDNVKEKFNEDEFKKDKITFLKTWINLCIKYPKTAIESFVDNSYGYWYPEYVYWVFSTGIENNSNIELQSKVLVENNAINYIEEQINNRDIPVISMLFSIGFIFWIILIMFTYCIYRKNYNLILIYVPILILWLTCLASPVSGEYRYVYAMFAVLPLFVGMNFQKKQEIEGEK